MRNSKKKSTNDITRSSYQEKRKRDLDGFSQEMQKIYGRSFFSFIEMVLKYAATAGDSGAEIVSVGLVISVLVSIFITSIILFFLFALLRDISEMKRKLMIIEDVKRCE